MGRGLRPDRYVESAFAVDYRSLYEEGYRGIIFDIDNTLVAPNAPADEKSKKLIRNLKEMGYATIIMSNNTGRRARDFAEAVNCPVVTGAWKPFPGRYPEALSVMHTTRENTMAIGDQIYTDIWGANNAGLYSILTKPLTAKEEFWIRVKRLLEKPVIGGRHPEEGGRVDRD